MGTIQWIQGEKVVGKHEGGYQRNVLRLWYFNNEVNIWKLGVYVRLEDDANFNSYLREICSLLTLRGGISTRISMLGTELRRYVSIAIRRPALCIISNVLIFIFFFYKIIAVHIN